MWPSVFCPHPHCDCDRISALQRTENEIADRTISKEPMQESNIKSKIKKERKKICSKQIKWRMIIKKKHERLPISDETEWTIF